MSAASHETQPLLQDADSNSRPRPTSGTDSIDVANKLTEDPDFPLQWTARFRWGIVLLLACTAFAITFTCFSIVPVASGIIEDLDGRQNRTASVLLVTIWELGEATGPFIIAPLSELFGRRPVMNICNIGLVVCTVVASFANSGVWIIATRFLSGMSVAVNVLNPAILGDMFPADQFGTAMSLVILAPLLGGAVGPVVGGGVLATRLGWRTMLRICASGLGICEILLLKMFRETFEPIILNHKFSKSPGRQPLRNSDQNSDARRLLLESLVRPFAILWSSSVLQAMSLFSSVAFAYYYMIETTLPTIMREAFHQTDEQAGFAFIPLSAGDLLSVLVCNILLDRVYVYLRRKHNNMDEPEYRLPLAICGACLLPLAISCFGWATVLPIIVIRLVLVLLGLSILTSSIPSMSYVVEAFGQYSASAMTAVIVTRCLVGALLPLAIEPMVKRLDYGLTFTIWGVFSLCLMPIPILCMRYGANLRQQSSYTKGH